MAPAFGRFRPRGFPTLARVPTSIKATRSNRSISVVSPTPKYRPLEIIALLTDLPGDRRHRYRICSVGVRIAMRIAVVPSPGSRLALAQEEPPNEPTTPLTTRRYRERKTPPIHCARIAVHRRRRAWRRDRHVDCVPNQDSRAPSRCSPIRRGPSARTISCPMRPTKASAFAYTRARRNRRARGTRASATGRASTCSMRARSASRSTRAASASSGVSSTRSLRLPTKAARSRRPRTLLRPAHRGPSARGGCSMRRARRSRVARMGFRRTRRAHQRMSASGQRVRHAVPSDQSPCMQQLPERRERELRRCRCVGVPAPRGHVAAIRMWAARECRADQAKSSIGSWYRQVLHTTNNPIAD